MKMKCLVFKFLLVFNIALGQSEEVFNQGVIIHGKLIENNQSLQGVRLIQLGVEQKALVQAQIISDTFALELPANLATGVYKLLFLGGQDRKEEVLFILEDDASNLVMELDFSEDQLEVSFYNSPENEVWYSYRKKEQETVQKHEVLFSFLANYPEKNSKLVALAKKEIQNERIVINKHRMSFLENNAGSLAALIVENQPYFFYDPLTPRSVSRKKEFESYWSEINATEPKLINSHVYSEHIIRYIRYYLDQAEDFEPRVLEDNLKRSIDKIIQEFSGNEETQAFAFEFLMKGFQEIGQERVLQYLEESYAHIADQCLDDIGKAEYEERMEGYAKLKKGKPAPEINFSFDQKLSEISADTTILVFWSTECPHCLRMIPKVDEWATHQDNIKVVGVSLDTNFEQFSKVAESLPNIMHHADGLGWNAPAVKDYYISGTPTLFVLDAKKDIIDKFDGFDKMLSYLK